MSGVCISRVCWLALTRHREWAASVSPHTFGSGQSENMHDAFVPKVAKAAKELANLDLSVVILRLHKKNIY